MAIKNQITISMRSRSENVGIARMVAAAFAAQLDFTLHDLDEIKVAVSEAVSNAVIHGYGVGSGAADSVIELTMSVEDGQLEFVITDYGKGIADIALARQPAFSTDPERMGLGFVFMESFMDGLCIESQLDKGTTVRLMKKIVPVDTP